MSKYKAGDKVTVLLDEMDALNLNRGSEDVIWKKKQIIAHESAPEPIVTYGFVLDNGLIRGVFAKLDFAKMESNGYVGVVGYIKTTITGNDFTVEKVNNDPR